jgi:GNAT superfamily N-acetyltransferase
VLERRLPDGSAVHLRPIEPGDKARLVAGMATLSDRSRWLRFQGAVNALSEKTLRHLTEVDQNDHIAWIALDPSRAEEPLIGVVRCVRIADEPTVAEVAVVVGDAYQNRGLGSLLLAVLAEKAAARGVATFRATVLRENATVVHALQEIGARGTVEEGLLHVDVPVAEVEALARTWSGPEPR